MWHLQQRYQLVVSRATVYRILRRAGLAKAEPKKRPHSSCIRSIVFAELIPKNHEMTDDEYRVVFAAPGVYQYSCGIHPAMIGLIVVQP